MSAVIGSVIGGLLVVANRSKKISAKDVEAFLKKKISGLEKSLEKKEIQLKKLQEEINKERQGLANYQYALDNLDLDAIANNVNAERNKRSI